MIRLLDSSVLVASLNPDEAFHEACDTLLQQADVAIYSHALNEAFSTLTGVGVRARVDADLAAQLISDSILPCVSVIELTSAEIVAGQKLAKKRGVRGGAIYDFMHLIAARKAGASEIYTLNLSDFTHIHRPGDPEIKIPE